MRSKSAILGLTLGLLASGSCLAETKILAEYAKTSYEDPYINVNPSVLSIGVDFNLKQSLSLVVKYGKGGMDDTDTTFLGTTDFNIDYLASANLKLSFMPESDWKPYVLVGYSQTELTAAAQGLSYTQKEKGMSYGAGVDYQLNDKVRLNLEYSQLINGDDADLTAAIFGISYSF